MCKNHLITPLILSILSLIPSDYAVADEIKKVLIIFSASWCQPCQVAKNDMAMDNKLINILRKYEIIDVDYDIDKDLVEGYNVGIVPTFIIYDGGKETGRKVGYSGGSSGLNKFLK